MLRRRHRQARSGSTSSTSSTPTSSRDRLGWTNLAGDPETGNVYAHGTQGLLFCFDKDGKVLWQHSLTEEFGRVTGYGGRVTSPIVDGDLVIIGMLNASWGDQARGGNRFVAFDKKHRRGRLVGEPATAPKDTYYSIPSSPSSTASGCSSPAAATAASTPSRSAPARRSGATTSAPAHQLLAGGGRQPRLHRPRRGEHRRATSRAGSSAWTPPRSRRQAEAGLEGGRHQGQVRLADRPRRPALRLRRHRPGSTASTPRRASSSGELQATARNTKGSPVWADGKIYVAEVNADSTSSSPGDNDCEEAARVPSSPPGASSRRDQRQRRRRQRPRLLHDQRRDVLHRQEGRKGERRRGRGRPAGRRAAANPRRPTCKSCRPMWP